MCKMEELISTIQKRDVIWNRKNIFHRDRAVVEKEWEYIAESLGVQKEDAKKKWRNLRDHFIKEFKKVPKNKSSESADYASLYPGKWQYFNSLLFLKDSVIPRDTDESMSQDVGLSRLNFTEEPIKVEPNDEEDFSDDEDEKDNSNTTPKNFGDVQHTIKEESPKMSMFSYEKPYVLRKKRRREESFSTENDEKKIASLEDDENFLFLRSLLPYMRKVSPLQQLRIRNKFHNVLIEELEHFEPKSNDLSDC